MYALQTDRRAPRRWTAGEPLPRRARWIVLAIVVGLAAAWMLGLGGDLGNRVAAGDRPAAGYQTVTVVPGDTLWTIAARRYPQADVRQKVFEIERLNGMAGPTIEAGQQLEVPAS
jgi:Tfp pilus assembly protein FimV